MGNLYSGRSIELPKTVGDTPHLWIVLTEPEGDPPQVVIVNLTSLKAGSDTTIILNVEDHPYITHETVPFYADAKLTPADALERIAQHPNYRFHDDCSGELLTTLRQGLLASRYTQKKIKEYCASRFGERMDEDVTLAEPL